MGDDFDGFIAADLLKKHPRNEEETGWLAPDGVMYFCGKVQHEQAARLLAKELLGWLGFYDWSEQETTPEGERWVDGCEFLSQRGWVRCCGNLNTTIQWMARTVESNQPRITPEQRRKLKELGYNPNDPFGWKR